MRLTPKQQRVLTLLERGWKLKGRKDMCGYWMQERLAGRCIDVHHNTVSSLLARGLIEAVETRFPLVIYEVSDE